MQTHVEIEAKYDADPDQPLPDLIGVAGIATVAVQAEMVLTATYLDTAGHDLGAAKTTLRRRTGGTDDGWHLKLSLADGERLEVHRALGRSSAPPVALTSLLRSLVRAGRLAPVATLVNRRTVHQLLDEQGVVVAEMSDDFVTGERLDAEVPAVGWREVEIELVEGDREALADLDAAMHSAGFSTAGGSSKVGRVLGSGPLPAPEVRRRTPAGEVLDAGLRGVVVDLLSADPLLRLDRAGAATRVRAVLRRLRAALALRRQVRPDDVTTELRAEVGWLDSVVAPLEHLDIARDEIDAGQTGGVERRMRRELAALRTEALSGVREALDSDRYLLLLDGLTALTHDDPLADTVTVRARALLPDLADRAAHRAERRLAQVVRAQSDQEQRFALVAARKAVERARYAASLLPARLSLPGRPELLDQAAETLAGLDAVVSTQDTVLDLADRIHAAGESTFALGRRHGAQELQADALRRRLTVVRKALKQVREG